MGTIWKHEKKKKERKMRTKYVIKPFFFLEFNIDLCFWFY